jgi:hypothetical protein
LWVAPYRGDIQFDMGRSGSADMRLETP